MSPDDQNKSRPPGEDDRERTVRFGPDSEEGDETPSSDFSERTQQLDSSEIEEIDPVPPGREGTFVLSDEEMRSEQAAGGGESTAHLGEAFPADAPVAEPFPETSAGSSAVEEITRREQTPLPRFPIEPTRTPQPPTPGLKLDDTGAAAKLQSTRPLTPGALPAGTAPTKPDLAATGTPASKNILASESPTRAGEKPLPSVAPTRSTPLPLTKAAAAPSPAPQTSRQEEEARDEEIEKPYSLEPDELTPATLETGSKTARRLPTLVWMLLGVTAGLALFTAYYFRPRAPVFSPPEVHARKGDPIAAAGNDAPPKTWKLVEGRFYGKDELTLPWFYDPATSKTLHTSQSSAGAPLARRSFTLVAEPPLEAHTRLAWIEDSNTSGGARLLCQDYDFSETASLPVQQTLQSPINLPAGKYPYAPLAIDHPSPAIGLLLVAVSDKGEASASRPTAQAGEQASAWNATLGAPPVHAPLAVFNADGTSSNIVLLFFTGKGVEAINATDGKKISELNWSLGGSGMKLAMAPMRAADKKGRAWGAWDGARGCVFELSATGTLKEIKPIEAKFDDQVKKAFEAISFPDPMAPERDGLWLVAEDGSLAHVASAVHAAPSGDERPCFSSVSLDFNGDGYWDLFMLKDNGDMWAADGASFARGNTTEAQRLKASAVAPATEIRWSMDNHQLMGDYFDTKGTPQRIIVELPKLGEQSAKAIAGDFNWRRTNTPGL